MLSPLSYTYLRKKFHEELYTREEMCPNIAQSQNRILVEMKLMEEEMEGWVGKKWRDGEIKQVGIDISHFCAIGKVLSPFYSFFFSPFL